MSPDDPGPPELQPNVWPPPPAHSASETWPPPPEAAALTVPFKYIPRRASGREAGKARLSDFREGSIQVGSMGIVVNGKAVLRAEIRYPIYLAAVVVARLLGIIAYAIMEYGFRRDEMLPIGWQAVRLVQLAPKKQQVCVVYDAANYKGIVKTFSLAFKLDPASYAALAAQLQQHVPGQLAEGNLRSVTTLRVWIRLVVLLMIVAFAVISAVTHHH